MQQQQLIFLISAPRSGSTLLQRMLGSHSEILTHPEPHLITPLAYLGYYDRVERAPFDHINAAEALRAFVSELPGKEEDYLEALRAYTDTLYGKMLATSPRSRFLDKTPAYALVSTFLTKLYPNAKYVVLTRHPLAVFNSYAQSFFNGDWATAHAFNPIVERYVPAIAQMLRKRPVDLLHVRYEDVVQAPEQTMESVFNYLGIENQSQVVNYGQHFQAKKGMGDPISVEKLGRPVADLKDAWLREVNADESKLALSRSMIERLDPEDVRLWGFSSNDIMASLKSRDEVVFRGKRKRLNTYMMKRRVMLALKKDIHERFHGHLLRKVRYYCDVLLRDA